MAHANALQAKNSNGTDADLGRARALAAYKDFLTLWKNADPEIPIYKEAKAKYAKLQRQLHGPTAARSQRLRALGT